MDESAIAPLRDGSVPFLVKPHEVEAFASEDVARERGVRVSQIVKCMVARSAGGELVALLIPGDKRLKLRKVRKFVDGSPLALVDPDELENEHGLIVGAISPIQLLGKARIFMDPTVLEEEFVDISSGGPCAGIELASADLREFVGAQVEDIVSSRSREPSLG